MRWQGIVFQSNKENKISQVIEVEGHLIDSNILSSILDIIMDLQGEFEFLEFNVGRGKNDYSSTKIEIFGETTEHRDRIVREVLRLGALLTRECKAFRRMGVPGDHFWPHQRRDPGEV